MKISGIYKIQSIIKSERIYIGSAINIHIRWGSHLIRLRLGKHENKKLQNHYNKYSKSDLIFSVILGCDKKDLLKVEQYFIDSYNPWFNNSKIAGSSLGTKRSEETRRKISQCQIGRIPWNKGKKASPETILKQSNSHKGKQKGKDHPMYGKYHTEESKKKMSESHKGKIPGNKGKKGLQISWNKGKHHSEIVKQKLKKAWELRKLKKI